MLQLSTDRKTSRPAHASRNRKSRLSVEHLEGREVPASGLGIASDFGAFVIHDANLFWSGIGGRAAVGGNANFSSYAIGDKLTNSNGTRDDLIVGGNLNFMYGQVYNGNVVYGGTGTLTSIGLPHGTAHQGTPIDFGAAETQLDMLSDQYAAMAPTAITKTGFGTVNLTGTDPSMNVFNVTAAQLWNATNLAISAPAGSSVIVNVSGTDARMQYMGMSVQGTTGNHVLLNFPEASHLTLAGIGVQGSVLAPRATVDFSNGDVIGTLVAHLWNGSGHIAYQAPEISPVSPSTLSGIIYTDLNGDGVAQPAEPRLQGVAVYLWGTDSGGHGVYQPATTDVNGAYSFTVNPGTYSIVAIPPATYSPGQSTIGTFGGTPTWNLITGISAPSGATSDGYNFGMLAPIP
jgi:choice-of-anchor A domain-containing protein